MSMVARTLLGPGHRALSTDDRRKRVNTMDRHIVVPAIMGLDFSTDSVQIYHDSWRGTNRTCRYRGDCRACGERTYAFDDGQNDPRGPLGDHAYWPVESERTGAEVTACALCANDYDAYQHLANL